MNSTVSGSNVTVSGSLANSIYTFSPTIDFSIRFNASSTGVIFVGYRNAYPSLEITRGSRFLYIGNETNPFRLFDMTGFGRFWGGP